MLLPPANLRSGWRQRHMRGACPLADGAIHPRARSGVHDRPAGPSMNVAWRDLGGPFGVGRVAFCCSQQHARPRGSDALLGKLVLGSPGRATLLGERSEPLLGLG
jgi:hypothetical protein